MSDDQTAKFFSVVPSLIGSDGPGNHPTLHNQTTSVHSSITLGGGITERNRGKLNSFSEIFFTEWQIIRCILFFELHLCETRMLTSTSASAKTLMPSGQPPRVAFIHPWRGRLSTNPCCRASAVSVVIALSFLFGRFRDDRGLSSSVSKWRRRRRRTPPMTAIAPPADASLPETPSSDLPPLDPLQRNILAIVLSHRHSLLIRVVPSHARLATVVKEKGGSFRQQKGRCCRRSSSNRKEGGLTTSKGTSGDFRWEGKEQHVR